MRAGVFYRLRPFRIFLLDVRSEFFGGAAEHIDANFGETGARVRQRELPSDLRRSAAGIWHVHHFHAGHPLEYFAGEMVRRTSADRSKRDWLALRFRKRNEVFDIARGYRCVDKEDMGHKSDEAHGNEIAL